MKNYVILVAETLDNKIVLIKKNRPEWQKGLYNFVGGKIEHGENSAEAASREFKEETGVSVDYKKLKYAGIIRRSNDFEMYVYYYKSDVFNECYSVTDEEIILMPDNEFKIEPNTIENIKWIYDLITDGFEKKFIIDYE